MKFRSLSALGTAFGVLFLPPSWAADQDPSVRGLHEVIVTAERRAENLQDVPVSVTAISGAALTSRGLHDMNDLFVAAPSLQPSATGDFMSFSIRGIGTLATSYSFESSAGTAIDGVSLGRSFLGSGVFDDVAQVEVLDGPQGLLFGKNASAGLVNITTVRPRLGIFEGKSEVDYSIRDTTPGDGSSVIGKATLNLPIGERSALRLNADYAKQTPVARIIAVAGNPEIQWNAKGGGVKAKYLFEASSALEVYVIADYHKETGPDQVQTYREIGPGSKLQGAAIGDGVTPGPGNLYYGVSGNAYRNLTTRGLQAQVTYRLPAGYKLINIAAWDSYHLDSNRDLDLTSTNVIDTFLIQESYRQYSEELRLATPVTSRISGQVGLYLFGLNLHSYSLLGGLGGLPPPVATQFPFCVGAAVSPGGPPACNLSNSYFIGSDENYELENHSYAAFGQYDFTITDPLKFIAGARLTRDDDTFHLAEGQLQYFVPLDPTAIRAQSASATNFSWKLGAQYRVSREAMVYATYGTGYKGPGFNDAPPTPTANMLVKPETVDSAEVGAKSSWLGNKLILDLSLFNERFKNFQVEAYDVGIARFILENSDSMTTRGAELTVRASPLRGWTITGTSSLDDARFGNFPGAPCYPGQPNCGATGAFNAKGVQTPESAKFSYSVESNYAFPISGAMTGDLDVNFYHRTPVNYSISDSPLTQLPAAGLLGASIGVYFGGSLHAAIYCRNCTDERVPVSLDFSPGDAGRGIATVIQTWGYESVRNIGLTVDYIF